MWFAVVALVAMLFSGADACVSGSCVNGMCKDIPKDNTYYLTSFCDKSVACGSFSGNCNEYYAADYSRFGCGAVSKYTFWFVCLFCFFSLVVFFFFLSFYVANSLLL